MGGLRKKEQHELARHYDRILAPSTQEPRASAALRLALRQIPMRLSLTARKRDAVLALVDRIVRVAELGGFDLIGTPRQLDAALAEKLGEEPAGARSVYMTLRLLAGNTALVERRSRQKWSLRISGLCDQSSAVHRALLAETPSVHVLAPERPPAEDETATETATITKDDVRELRRIIDELNAELIRERQLRADVEAKMSAAGPTVEKAIAIVNGNLTRRTNTPPTGGEESEGAPEGHAAARAHPSRAFDSRPGTRLKKKSKRKRRNR